MNVENVFQPMSCHMMEEGHAAALGQKLNDRLAQLNAAVAALATATSGKIDTGHLFKDIL